ncbi:C2 calcium-dependent domain-containing protein 4A [Pangasianodon hypophthalmus]|uniref:C2 calcium-dependent domain-containing protein 4A n=1 Tax=Pangasianodon hypophthalmus TaxID=310915 RepID=UPI002307CD31|nr:C2 calcium-dependent domain-containing protein 4A [Pangasianodon hypophthalmus]
MTTKIFKVDPMWVVEKIRVSVEKTNLFLPTTENSFNIGRMFGEKASADKAKKAALCPNIITPDTIPEFCIPPKISSPLEVKGVEQGKATPCITVSCSESYSPKKEIPFREPISSHIIQVESVDDGPCNKGCSDEENTNADPQSQAALSLPHLAKAQTCYGFCTLLESPHTRRKESLFHNDPNSSGIPLLLPRSRSNTCSRFSSAPVFPASTSPSSFSLNNLTSKLSRRGFGLHRQATQDSDTTSSAESSPFSSPLLARSLPKPSLFKTLSHEKLLYCNIQKTTVSRNNSLSTDEASSTDNSPNVMRRSSEVLIEPLSSSFGLAPPAIFPLDLVLYRERVMKESLVPVGRDGTLRLSAEYCPENQRMRVRLISAEGLYSLSVDPKSINCSISLALMPGKFQKQRSTVIRKSRNPIFNEDFFFDGITEEDLSHWSLRFKVVNKMSTMKRDYILGSCDLPLTCIVSL